MTEAYCDGAQRASVDRDVRDGITVAVHGTEQLTGLGASLLVEADEMADCGEAVVF